MEHLTNFELILVDDGSPDRRGEICDKVAQQDSRVRVIHQQNAGLSEARNKGVRLATKEYLTFIDGDDLIPENYLEILIHAAVETKADIITCGSLHFRDGTAEPPASVACPPSTKVKVLSKEDACKAVYSNHPYVQISAWGKLFARSLKEQIIFPAGKIYEDQWLIPILLYKADTVAYIPACLYYYRVRSGSITAARFSKKNFDNLEALDHAVLYFKAQGASEVAKYAEFHREEVRALWVILAKIAKVKGYPRKYRQPLRKAFQIVKVHYPQKYYDLLNQVYPQRKKLSRMKHTIKRLLHSK